MLDPSINHAEKSNSDHGIAPVIGIILMLALTLTMVSIVGAVVLTNFNENSQETMALAESEFVFIADNGTHLIFEMENGEIIRLEKIAMTFNIDGTAATEFKMISPTVANTQWLRAGDRFYVAKPTFYNASSQITWNLITSDGTTIVATGTIKNPYKPFMSA